MPPHRDEHAHRLGQTRLTGGLALHYDHDGGDFAAAVHRCTGVGKCTVAHPADGRLVDGGWSAPEVHDSLELCLACKGCAQVEQLADRRSLHLAELLASALRP